MSRAALLVVAGQDVVGVVGNVLASTVGDHSLFDRAPEGAQGELQRPLGRAVHLASGEHPIMGLDALGKAHTNLNRAGRDCQLRAQRRLQKSWAG